MFNIFQDSRTRYVALLLVCVFALSTLALASLPVEDFLPPCVDKWRPAKDCGTMSLARIYSTSGMNISFAEAAGTLTALHRHDMARDGVSTPDFDMPRPGRLRYIGCQPRLYQVAAGLGGSCTRWSCKWAILRNEVAMIRSRFHHCTYGDEDCETDISLVLRLAYKDYLEVALISGVNDDAPLSPRTSFWPKAVPKLPTRIINEMHLQVWELQPIEHEV